MKSTTAADSSPRMPSGAGLVDSCPSGAETDLWWSGYAGRTMWPSFALAGMVAVAIIGAALYGWAVRGMDRLEMRYTAYGMIALLGVFQFGRWLYRVVTWNYRLTTRNVFIERNFINKRRPSYPLSSILDVEMLQGSTDRLVNVGTIHIRLDDQSELRLPGVCEPSRVACLIRDAVSRARAGRAAAMEHPGVHAITAGHREGDV